MHTRPLMAYILLSLLLNGCGSSSNNNEIPDSDNNTASKVSQLDWPIENEFFDAPSSTFTLTDITDGSGIYITDIQQSYPDIDWENIDRLYIPSGHYPFLKIGNLPDREANKPLIITNIDGQVRIGGLGHYYLTVLSGGSNWVLTGRYDELAKTGDINYPGHRGGLFANTQDTYGIMIDDDFVANGVSGLKVSEATHFTIEYLEIKEVDFAGMSLKTDDDGDADMQGVTLNDNYIHDTGSEGLYIGSTQTQPQHQIVDWNIYNNRILRTGTEAIQLGQLAGETNVHHNVFGPAAIDWRAAFQVYQDNNFQIGIREGHLAVYNNIFLGSAGSMISLFGQYVDGDATNNNLGITFTDNYFSGIRNLGMYINSTSLEGMVYKFENNNFGGYDYQRDEVYSTSTEYDHLLRIFNNDSPISFSNNNWLGTTYMTNIIDNNGDKDNVSGIENNNIEPTSLTFVNSGLDDDFDYLNIEMWTSTASLGDDQAVDYQQGDIVMYFGAPFQCNLIICTSTEPPTEQPDTWTSLPQLADDVRIDPGSIWESIGLMPQ